MPSRAPQAPPAKERGVWPPRFWLEQRSWPLTHYLTPGALYWATRDPVWSVLGIYIWETLETSIFALFRGRYVMFAGTGQTDEETALDSLVGDPAMGTLAILTLYAADAAFGWPGAFVWPVWLRVVAFAAQALPSALVDWRASGTDRGFRTGALVFGAWYVLAGLLAYGIPLIASTDDDDDAVVRTAAAALLAWLAVAAVQTAQVVLFAEPPRSSTRAPPLGPTEAVWSRVFGVGLVVLAFVALGSSPRTPVTRASRVCLGK